MLNVNLIYFPLLFFTLSLTGCFKYNEEGLPGFDSTLDEEIEIDRLEVALDGDVEQRDRVEVEGEDRIEVVDHIVDHVEEEEDECLGDGDCDDGDICNGYETCNLETHFCEEGINQEDGFVCGGDEPRMICLSGECVESLCGDGFIDSGADEFCEPPGEGDCNDNCRIGCDGSEDCPDDGNMCNGEEYCDTDVNECSRRNVPAEGTECQGDPRMICLAQTCRESVCGDEYVDGIEGEQCDDGNTDNTDSCLDSCLNASCGDGFVWAGVEECDSIELVPCTTECGITGEGICSGTCTLPAPSECSLLPGECCTPLECEDGNECTVDTCESNICRSTPIPDGSACSEGYCCGGVCQECCNNLHCEDSDPCTENICTAGVCFYVQVPDMTSCGIGVCCDGACITGADCCSNGDCTSSCSGTAHPCSTFDITVCNTQAGCSWHFDGECSGLGVSCSGHSTQPECEACGCTWGFIFFCNGFARCSEIDDETTCTGCGCTWETGCIGTHQSCSSYPNMSDCNAQQVCHWHISMCVANQCT